MENQENGRNRRSLRNLLVFPSGQIRLVFMVPVAGLLSMLVILQALKTALINRLTVLHETYPGASNITDLLHVVTGIFNLGIIFLALCSTLVAAFGLFLTHRYYGPLIPILRALRAMKQGDYSRRVQLRPGDELRELAHAVNELNDELHSRSRR